MLQPEQLFYTLEEYLWQEQRAAYKNEYYNGTIYAMAGGSPEHSQLQSNPIVELGIALRSGNCRVLTSDLKVGVEGKLEAKNPKRRKKGKDFITYPDVSVVCGALEPFKGDRFTIANPLVLFEVLSPSTRNYDSSFKLQNYQKIASLKAYIIIDSEQVWVKACQRIGNENRWILEEPLEDLEDLLRIEPLDLEIPLRRLYQWIEFEKAAE